MPTLKKYWVVLGLCLLMALVSCKAGKTSTLENGAVFTTEGISAELDEVNLKKGLATYFSRSVNKARQARGVTGEDVTISASAFAVEAKKAIRLGPNTYYAVKVSCNVAEKYGFADSFPMRFVTEPSGTLYMFGMMHLEDGSEAILARAPEVSNLSLPEAISPKLLTTGQGTKAVVFISDPFCGYCRQGYEYLKNNMGLIGELRVVHNPIFAHMGSDIAAWVMDYAVDENYQPLAVYTFTYTGLQPFTPREVDGQIQEPTEEGVATVILEQYQTIYPDMFKGMDTKDVYTMLKARYADEIEQDAALLRDSEFTSTPVFVVGGKVIKGFGSDKIDELLRAE